MDDVVSALAEQQTELSEFLADLDESGWQRPSLLEGWCVSDVVLHLAQTNEMAVASLDGQFVEVIEGLTQGLEAAPSVDEGVEMMVARERDEPASAIEARWRAGVAALGQRFRSSDLHQRVQWIAGTLSARTLAATRLAETWIHTGDITGPFGVAPAPRERLRHIARLAWRTLPYAFARDGRELTGPVAFELTGPAGARWDFVPDERPLTTITGDALELCLVAGRRLEPAETQLQGEGPDADAVLELVRTYA